MSASPADPIMTFFGRYVSHEMSDPQSGLYLPSLIKEMSLEPYSFGAMNVDQVTETDDIICLRPDEDVQPACNGYPRIKLTDMMVKGLSNIVVYQEPVYRDVNHFELSFTFTKPDQTSSLTFYGDFRLDQQCRYPEGTAGKHDFTATGMGTFTAIVGTAYIKVLGEMNTDGQKITAMVDQIQFDALAFIEDNRNISISVDITEHEDWNFYAEQALNMETTIGQMTAQLSGALNGESIRQVFADKITKKINEVIS
ncbi:hypothetical protein D3C74_90030 [compost metagenome]